MAEGWVQWFPRCGHLASAISITWYLLETHLIRAPKDMLSQKPWGWG